jgi:type IV pilus assembly protein PilV
MKKKISTPLRRLLESRAGFSLVEVLVAVSIFAFGMLGLAAGAISITRANKTSQFHTMATSLAQEKLEQLKSTSVAFVSSCTSSCEADPPTYLGVTFTRSWSAALNVPQPGLKQITVTVDWRDYTTHTVTVISAMPTS